MTAEQRLRALKAKCVKSKLLDGDGKEIRFYRLQGCWGNPPADYRDILQRQSRELSALKKRFTVIEIPCDSTGDPRRISSFSPSEVSTLEEFGCGPDRYSSA